ncbi:UNKNOWN [Stylonychia lemnae]|uniref:Uncharacterized protein n=1 Tax=Stylonychia lemnae TaxID=5949 RepID=A0A078AEN2_STYLE|nr:UNKNOWN [Stylonychia lemnae]|eukprot:CDW80729.1 UNKNOWN [Stylonychia lemnae]
MNQSQASTISMKLIGKITAKKENLQLNNYTINEFRDNQLSSTNSTLQNQLKEIKDNDQNKANQVSSPPRQLCTVEEGILKHIQQKIQVMEDQISKIEYSQDTMRPVLRQIQTPQGQIALLNQFQKQQLQMLNPKEQEKQQQIAEQQYEILKNLKSQSQDQLDQHEELFKKSVDGLKIKKMELDFNLEQSSKYLASQLRESEFKILDDKAQLQNDIQRKQNDIKDELLQKIEQMRQNQQSNSAGQSQRMQSLYERLDDVQKIYSQRLNNLEQRVKPISEVISQAKKNDSNQLQLQLSKLLEEQMRNTVLSIKGTFEEKFQSIQDQQKQETDCLKEDLSKLNIKIAQQSINMTADNRISELTFKKVKNQTKSVANLSPNSEYNKNKTIDQIQSQSKSVTRKQNQIQSQTQNQLREDIKKSFEGLESFSLKTSEDINEELENLNGCIESNSNALQKSLYDLQDLKDSQKGKKDIEDFANRIISQFSQFSDYIRNEVSKIRKLILHRQQSADQELKKQDSLVDQLHKVVMSESQISGQSVVVKLDQIKEHQDALKKHLANTQGYLTREANQVDLKLMQLQDFIVKEIEPYIPQADDSENQIDQYGANQKPFSGINKQNISAIQEEGAEYLHTEDQLDDSIGN